MGFLEIDARQPGAGDVSIPLRLKVRQTKDLSKLDTHILSLCVYNQARYRPRVAEHKWEEEAPSAILSLWGLGLNQKIGAFEITSAVLKIREIEDERIYFRTSNTITVSEEGPKINGNRHNSSAYLLGSKFLQSFKAWSISPVLLEELQREINPFGLSRT